MPACNTRRHGSRQALLIGGSVGFIALLLVLANCGASSSPMTAGESTATPFPQRTATPYPTTTIPPPATPAPTATPVGITPTALPVGPTPTAGPQSFAYVFSRVDYPLQIAVGNNDTVTLLLSTNSGILEVTPMPGQGNGQATAPIPLPTDVEHYRDIGATVDTASDGTSPIAWQLTSAPRQSLLDGAPGNFNRHYHDAAFTWNVHAVNAGQNLVKITLGLYFVYLSGQEADGSIQVTASPVPIVAVTTTPFDDLLRRFKLPLSGIAAFGTLIGLVRFVYGIFEKVNTVTSTVKDAATVAQEAQKRLQQFQRPPQRPTRPPDQLPPTLPRPRR